MAVLTLAGYALPQVRTPVLALNLCVSTIAFLLFRHAGHLRPRLLWPLLVASVPAAFVGAYVPLSGTFERALLGLVLLAAGLRLLALPGPPPARFRLSPESYAIFAVAAGAVLGFLAGATGIGGGIFLSPVLLFLGWANVKETGALASAFIALNSLSGLLARTLQELPDWRFTAPLLGAVALGGALGAFFGSHRLPSPWLQRLLGLVLLVAAGRALL